MAREKITLGGGDEHAGETPGDAGAEDAALRLVAEDRAGSEELAILQLRPRNFDEYVGQQNVMHSLKIAVTAASKRGEPVDHVLFHGPPGLGKTTLAHIIAREMNVRLEHTSGPALERPADMVGLLSNLEAGAVLFIDEIHRLSSAVEEYLYSAMEDYRVDFVTGAGVYAKTLSFPLQPFTLVGATTRAGLLSSPLRDRFGMIYHMEYYSDDELTSVVTRSAGILGVEADAAGAAEIARRSRGTPRVANRLLRRVRDFAQVEARGNITREIASAALDMEGVDELGLDRLDRLYLTTLAHQYNGGPAGIAAISATVNEEPQTLEDVVEPFLLKCGFVIRTPGGRRVTPEGMRHAGAPVGGGDISAQGTLL